MSSSTRATVNADPGAGVNSPKRVYRVAIIGTGRQAGFIEDEARSDPFGSPYSHVAAYQSMPETEVVAVANRSAERMVRFAQRIPSATGGDHGR